MVGRAKPVRPCHKYGFETCFGIYDVWFIITNIRIIHRYSKYFLFFFTLKRTKTDINGQKRTLRLREVLSLHCASGRCLIYDVWCLMYYPEGNHTSYIKHQTSYIKHHTSSIKHHTSSIINHTSNIIHHKSLTLKLNKNYGKISNLFSSPAS